VLENLAGEFRATATLMHFAQWVSFFCCRTLYNLLTEVRIRRRQPCWRWWLTCYVQLTEKWAYCACSISWLPLTPSIITYWSIIRIAVIRSHGIGSFLNWVI